MKHVPQYEVVPVPQQFVGDVYSLLGRLMDPSEIEDAGDGVFEDVAEEEVALTPDLIERIYSESYDQHRKLFKYLAAHPGEWFYSDALAEALELPNGNKSLAGMLGALGRRAKHRYNGLRPLVSEWDQDAGQMRHMMTGEVAKVIAAL